MRPSSAAWRAAPSRPAERGLPPGVECASALAFVDLDRGTVSPDAEHKVAALERRRLLTTEAHRGASYGAGENSERTSEMRGFGNRRKNPVCGPIYLPARPFDPAGMPDRLGRGH